MDTEKGTVEGSGNHKEEKGAAQVEEKSVVKEDACELGEVGEKEENGGKEEVNEKAVEMEEEKEEVKGNATEEEEVNEEEQGKGGGEEGSGEEEEDKGEGKEELKAEKGSSKKGSRTGKSKSEKAELASPRTPGIERPTRERKTVDRFVVNATPRGSATKLVAIEKGQGTKLKDIPNVSFKLSKRKADENLQLLHTILFGKKAKVQTLKKNIGRFSGFVWIQNEEKQRAKLKGRLDKCVKEKLLDFCDVLNIPVSKATVKKEELSVKLSEFLESPHATTDILLSEKDMRKSKISVNKSSADMAAGKSRKKPKLDSESKKKRKHSSEERDDNKSEHSLSEDDQDDDNAVSRGESEKETTNSEEEDQDQDEPEKQMIPEKSSMRSSTKKDSGNRIDKKSKAAGKQSSAEAPPPGNSTKKSSSSKSKKRVSEAESRSEVRTPVTKKRKVDKQSEETSTPPEDTSSSKKKASKSSTKMVEKDQGKNESSKNAKKQPTKEEMHAVVTNILKEVDFNTATLSDILKQLGKHFGIDLMHRKSEIKEIITEVINNMSDDEDEEAAESGDDLGKESKDDEA